MTKLGCPVAHPRFSSRPSASTSTLWPSGKRHSSYCGLMLIFWMPGVFLSPAMSISLSKWPMLPTIALSFIRRAHEADEGQGDLVVEVADVADDRLVLHPLHVPGGDDVEVAGRGDEEVRGLHHVLHRRHLEALHRGLERADRIDLGDDDPCPLAL